MAFSRPKFKVLDDDVGPIHCYRKKNEVENIEFGELKYVLRSCTNFPSIEIQMMSNKQTINQCNDQKSRRFDDELDYESRMRHLIFHVPTQLTLAGVCMASGHINLPRC